MMTGLTPDDTALLNAIRQQQALTSDQTLDNITFCACGTQMEDQGNALVCPVCGDTKDIYGRF